MTERRSVVLLISLAALLSTAPAEAESPSAALLLSRLEAKGVVPPAWDEGVAEDEWIDAVGRVYLDELGVGDSHLAMQRWFGRGGECGRVAPSVTAEFAREIAWLLRPLREVYGGWEDFALAWETLRAVSCVLPLVTRPGVGGLEIAPAAEWRLLRLVPDLAEPSRVIGAGSRGLKEFVGKDAVREWIRQKVAENARRRSRDFWDKVETSPGIRKKAKDILLATKDKPLRDLFGKKWETVTADVGMKRYEWSLVYLSLVARGRKFLTEFLPRARRGDLPVRECKYTGSVCGYYTPMTQTLYISFSLPPPDATVTLIHEGAHALDDLANGWGRDGLNLRRRAVVMLVSLSKHAEAAIGAGDDLGLRHYVRRIASIYRQLDHFQVEGLVEKEYIAWRTEASFASEATFLVLTRAMVESAYLNDRDAFERTIKLSASYAADPRVVESFLATKDWDAPEGIRRDDRRRGVLDPSREFAPEDARGRCRLADAYLVLGQFDHAKRLYSRALAEDLTLANAHCGLGAIHAAEGETGRAVVAYSRALENSPDMTKALIGRGDCLKTLRSYRRALADFTRAAELLGGDSAEPWAKRAEILLELRRWKAALEDLTRAVDVEPRNVRYRARRALAFRMVGEMAKARQELERALAIAPNDADAILERAELSFAEGKLEAARADLDRVILLEPRRARAYRLRARIHDLQGNAAAAAADRARAAEIE